MSGKFTKMRYDQSAYDDEVARSTNPLLYRLDPNFANNCNQCYMQHGPSGGHIHNLDAGKRIDVDSILRGISKINTKSNIRQVPDSLAEYHTAPKQCSNGLEATHSRYTHPVYEIKGLASNDMRFDYPLHDPQCNIFENFAVNSRLQAKDDHRTEWQSPIDQRDSLPRERVNGPKKCTVSFNCGYAPY